MGAAANLPGAESDLGQGKMGEGVVFHILILSLI